MRFHKLSKTPYDFKTKIVLIASKSFSKHCMEMASQSILSPVSNV